ncbi:ABC transporter ATP-binding protein/permease [Aurantivibrio plasticivorans]
MVDEQRNKELVGWLASRAQPFERVISLITFLSIGKFIVQVMGLWVLTGILNTMLTEAAHDRSALLWLCLFFSLQLAAQFQIDRAKSSLFERVGISFSDQLSDVLRSRSLAVIRDHSCAAWQLFYMKRLVAIQEYYSNYLPQKRLASVIPFIVLLLVIPISWVVALLLAVSAPLIPLFMWVMGQGAAEAHREHFKVIERLSDIFQDRLRARQLIHVHHALRRQQEVFSRAAMIVRDRTLKVVRLAFLSSSVLDFFATLAMALVAVFVGFSLLGELNFGSWRSGLSLHEGLFSLMIVPIFFNELKTLGRFYHQRAEAIGAADQLCEVLSPNSRADVYSNVARELNLNNMEIRVPGGDVLVGASHLILDVGDKVLIKGASGSGKTTLLEALIGIREMYSDNPHHLNPNQVAWLTQSADIVAGSVRENLCLNIADYNDRQLLEVIDKVELTGWLNQQALGLDAPMGDFPPLSGGQRQRLAIARIILFDLPIIFLDEPTAHLGLAQAQRVVRLLKEHVKDKTVLWVSHDKNEDEFFNKIWFLDDHRLHETHRGALCA